MNGLLAQPPQEDPVSALRAELKAVRAELAEREYDRLHRDGRAKHAFVNKRLEENEDAGGSLVDRYDRALAEWRKQHAELLARQSALNAEIQNAALAQTVGRAGGLLGDQVLQPARAAGQLAMGAGSAIGRAGAAVGGAGLGLLGAIGDSFNRPPNSNPRRIAANRFAGRR